MSVETKTIDTLLEERRTFRPTPECRARARVTDDSLYRAAASDPEAFWAEPARKYISRHKPWDRVLEWNLPFAKWFSALRGGYDESADLIVELRGHVAKLIGPIARPKWIAFTPDLPKTRSGKIMRRLLRDIAENRQLGDTTTLADANIVADLQRRAQEEQDKEA